MQAEWAETGGALQAAGAHGQAVYAKIVQLLRHRALSAGQTQAALLESIRDLQRSQQCRAAMALVGIFPTRSIIDPLRVELQVGQVDQAIAA